MPPNWSELADRLTNTLHLSVAPVAITFAEEPPPDVPAFGDPMSEPTEDGRQGRVAAGCVFWVRGAEQAFSTVPEDHGNCSVGSITHGMLVPTEVTGRTDIGALLGAGWVGPGILDELPKVSTRPGSVVYAPLGTTTVAPDVVMLRVNARQMMVLSDAIPELSIRGKPQCHVVALAKEHGIPAASVGCALSRQRTGMRPDEMTCALPAPDLESIVSAVEQAAAIDGDVAHYAAEDARRFA